MDNAAIHASKKAVSFLDNLGCSVLYNAPYAPELNPIEVVIGAVKRILKTNIWDNRQVKSPFNNLGPLA